MVVEKGLVAAQKGMCWHEQNCS